MAVNHSNITSGRHFFYDLAQWGSISIDRPLSREEFINLADHYTDCRLERAQNGKVTIMSPVKEASGNQESIVIGFIYLWWLKHRAGRTYSSSTGIELPDGSIKCPDAAWVSQNRLDAVPIQNRDGYLQAVPDFIVEVRSESDRLPQLQEKMTNVWMKHGVRLGWLIDVRNEKVYIYREQREMEVISGFADKELSGEDVMPDMTLPLNELMVKKS
ncbi:MAG: Uma2 family endonuclease [Bacteroidota bacterium]